MNLNSSGNRQHSKSDYLHTRHVKKLQIDLNVPASSDETQELLTHKVPNSVDEALSQYAGTGIRRSESPHPSSGRPHSDGYDHDHGFKDSNHKDASRKKKSSGSSISKWKQQVKVSPEIGLEVPPNDGYMWRKYGQKEILNAKYPREYYRCTYRSTHGCCATKQVQRSTDDPSIFEITYLGNHTCPKITKTTDSLAAVESAYGLINFSSPLESASATSRTPGCSAATKPTSTVTRNSFELSNWSQDHN